MGADRGWVVVVAATAVIATVVAVVVVVPEDGGTGDGTKGATGVPVPVPTVVVVVEVLVVVVEVLVVVVLGGVVPPNTSMSELVGTTRTLSPTASGSLTGAVRAYVPRVAPVVASNA